MYYRQLVEPMAASARDLTARSINPRARRRCCVQLVARSRRTARARAAVRHRPAGTARGWWSTCTYTYVAALCLWPGDRSTRRVRVPYTALCFWSSGDRGARLVCAVCLPPKLSRLIDQGARAAVRRPPARADYLLR